MSLREVKKEVESLANVDDSLRKFQENWIGVDSPLLNDLAKNDKTELQRKLKDFEKHFKTLSDGQQINEKLRHYAKYLIELKLTTFNGDKQKSMVITNRILNDDFLSLQNTLNEVSNFQDKVDHFSASYDHINMWLAERLTLENSLLFNEQSHKLQFKILMKTLEKQKKVIRKLGQEFVSLTRKTRMGK